MLLRRAVSSFFHTRRVTHRALLSVGGAWSDFAAWFNRLGLSENAILLGFGVAIGAAAGHVPVRPALARTLASAVTLGSGGSAGVEGPVAVLGAAVGSFLGRVFRFDVSRVRVLVAAGTAAGISAAFNAPLAGAFFALEEILGSLAAGTFPPVVVSSVVAAVVSRAFLGNHPAFPIPAEYVAGLIAVADLGRVAAEHRDLIPTLHAADLAEPVEAVTPTHSLLEAVRRIGVRGTDTVPVVDAASGRFLGLVRRAHLLGLYERHLAGGAGRPAATRSHAAPAGSRIP